MLLNPNGILFLGIQFAFNNPLGKSEHLMGFKKIVWVPGMARDQKNRQKYLKIANISHFECGLYHCSSKSMFKAERWTCSHYNCFIPNLCLNPNTLNIFKKCLHCGHPRRGCLRWTRAVERGVGSPAGGCPQYNRNYKLWYL
jgi:hypothetical protein